MRHNRKSKRTGSKLLAVCLIAALLLSNQSFGVFAEEEENQNAVQEEAQSESLTEKTNQETDEEDSSEGTENNEEDVTDADVEPTPEEEAVSEENVVLNQENESETVTNNSQKDFSVSEQNEEEANEVNVEEESAWTVTSGVVTVAGNEGTQPESIRVASLTDRSKYQGNKSIVFGYDISSESSITGKINISIEDCGIMSDDNSIEVWKIEGDSCAKINAELTITEGKISFETDSLGSYLAVSDVTTVDLTKDTVTIYSTYIQGKQQDGTDITEAFSDTEGKKYRIAQSNNLQKTGNRINFTTNVDYNQTRAIILDGINTSNSVDIPAYNKTVQVKLLLRNENQIHHIYYGTGRHDSTKDEEDVNNDSSRLTIDSYDATGELYIPYKMSKEEEITYVTTTSGSQTTGSYWSMAGIGGGSSGNCNDCTGLTIAGGTIRVFVTNASGATAIGGGGNGDGEVTITGGNITAVCSSTGAAIGGGIGWINRGGKADVTISGGTVYAENMGYYTRDNISYGGVAIGSGSSQRIYGSAATIKITGGTVTAYARYGNAIGSGNSYQGTAAEATIDISGNSIITTNALGGGTSKESKGGSAKITVSDNAIVNCQKYSEIKDKWDSATENILGAFGIGGGNSAGSEKGGSAVVNISGGKLNCNGGNIGGGNATEGDGGDASIFVSGGILDCSSIGGGNSNTGTPGSVTSETQTAGVVVTGGTLKAGTIGGGTNSSGEIGFATADISGGEIQGQFILANTDTEKQCIFQMTGGTIDNTKLDTENYKKVQENGGAVYLSDPNGKVTISGGTIQNCKANLGGAIYMTAGTCKVSGGKIKKCSAKNGGAVYLENGTVQVSGGNIGIEEEPNSAENGAGVYMAGGNLTVSGGTIGYNEATTTGGGAYLAGGNLAVTGGNIAHNTAPNGGGAYLEKGDLNISDQGSINDNTATDQATGSGGGAYLANGNLTLTGGTIASNHAVKGGGSFVADGKVHMFGGTIERNTTTGDGAGLYVSSVTSAADVVIRSGSITGNEAQGNGGGIAVAGSDNATYDHIVLGLLETHTGLTTTDDGKRIFTAFDYTETIDDNQTHNHASCPVLSNNKAVGDGGGIFMESSNATLNIYCLDENGNRSEKNTNGNSIMTRGGTVSIGDSEKNNAEARGNIVISSVMLVEGGKVDIYGNMTNPLFKNNVLVDIQSTADHFIDHRTQASGETHNYKVHYFENFTDGGTQAASGLYSAMQYTDTADVPALGTIFEHEGWKIVGWDTEADGKGTRYNIGTNIGDKADHTAWGTDIDKALVLYAIWQRTGYTVSFEANAGKNTCSGTMADQTFEYNVSQPLTANAYKITGKRFTGWNTKEDGKGDSYAADYSDSKMTSEDNKVITLYAQWVDCTHLNGDHPGNVTYQVDEASKTITETCDCGYTASVTLTAVNVYYDQKEHPATVKVNGTLLEGTPTVSYQYSSDGTSYGAMPEGTTVPRETGFYKASITVSGKTVSVEYEIMSPTAGIRMIPTATAGQNFGDFAGDTSVTISQDDAFTMQFTVQNLKTEVYQTIPTLNFEEKLPDGTTIIMQTDNNYWYIRPSSKEIALDQFTKMGEDTKFSYTSSENQSYRFIVDFSQAAMSGGSQKVSLTYSPTDASGDLMESIQLVTTAKTEFGVTFDQAASTAKITAPASTDSNRWNGKQLILVLQGSGTDATAVPADAKLTVTIGDQKTEYRQNARKQFVIPLTWAESQNVNLKLDSDLATAAGQEYDLQAKLYAGTEGEMLLDTEETADISLKVSENTQPSVKITGTQRLITNETALKLIVNMKNIEGYTVSASIQKKGTSGYNGTYLSGYTVKEGENTIPLSAITESGSYCLSITLTKQGQNPISIPYYFTVEK